MTLFDVQPTATRAPRRTPPRGVQRPERAAHTPKWRQKCDDCLRVAYETLQAGEGFPGVRLARWERRDGDGVLFLCGDHAAIRKADDSE